MEEYIVVSRKEWESLSHKLAVFLEKLERLEELERIERGE